MEELRWLGVIRHGESAGNVAAAAAELAGVGVIGLAERDADVPLSDTGQRQAAAVGDWLRGQPAMDLVVASPYVRAMRTAELATAGSGLVVHRDERLRDRELGVLDLLTARGVLERFPDEAARRRRLGKFYYRPPGGESWADVTLRLRAFLGDLRRDHPDGRVLLFAHEAPVLLLRYLVEGLTETELLDLARVPVTNASLTCWQRADGDTLRLVAFNDDAHLVSHERAVPTQEAETHAEPV